MIVVFSEEAEADLERIGDYIARDNPRRAATFVDELAASCLEIGDMPRAYPPLPAYEQFGVGRRVHGNYLIFYRIEDGSVFIVHILHGASAFADILFPN